MSDYFLRELCVLTKQYVNEINAIFGPPCTSQRKVKQLNVFLHPRAVPTKVCRDDQILPYDQRVYRLTVCTDNAIIFHTQLLLVNKDNQHTPPVQRTRAWIREESICAAVLTGKEEAPMAFQSPHERGGIRKKISCNFALQTLPGQWNNNYVYAKKENARKGVNSKGFFVCLKISNCVQINAISKL